MKKILIISKGIKGAGGFKSSLELLNALKVSKKNYVKIYTEFDAKKK
jgi:hypothetical protein